MHLSKSPWTFEDSRSILERHQNCWVFLERNFKSHYPWAFREQNNLNTVLYTTSDIWLVRKWSIQHKYLCNKASAAHGHQMHTVCQALYWPSFPDVVNNSDWCEAETTITAEHSSTSSEGSSFVRLTNKKNDFTGSSARLTWDLFWWEDKGCARGRVERQRCCLTNGNYLFFFPLHFLFH